MIVKFFFDYVLSIFRKIDRPEIVHVLDFLVVINEMLRRFSAQSDHESLKEFDWFHRFHCLSTLAPIQHTIWARPGRSGRSSGRKNKGFNDLLAPISAVRALSSCRELTS